jgi:thymidylate kinase
MKRRGLLYVFEGPDGVGKTTLSSWYAKHLESKGKRVMWSSFPGKVKGTLGDLVYRLHHAPSKFGIKSIEPLSLQMLHVAAHIEVIQSTFVRQLESGTSIVLDRYWWSTWVYGCVAGADPAVLESMIEIEKRTWGRIRPHRVILMSRFRRDATTLDHELEDLYEKIARREAKAQRVVAIANNGPISSTHKLLLSSIK